VRPRPKMALLLWSFLLLLLACWPPYYMVRPFAVTRWRLQYGVESMPAPFQRTFVTMWPLNPRVFRVGRPAAPPCKRLLPLVYGVVIAVAAACFWRPLARRGLRRFEGGAFSFFVFVQRSFNLFS